METGKKNSGFRPEAGREGRLLFGGWHPSVWKEKTVLEVEGGEGYTTKSRSCLHENVRNGEFYLCKDLKIPGLVFGPVVGRLQCTHSRKFGFKLQHPKNQHKKLKI